MATETMSLTRLARGITALSTIRSMALGIMLLMMGVGSALAQEIPADSFAVEVTPDGSTVASRSINTGPFTQVFNVFNAGLETATFTLTCGGSLVTCDSLSETSVTLNPFVTTNVTATYTVGSTPGTGSLAVNASGHGVGDQGSIVIPITGPSLVIFEPGPTTVATGGGGQIVFETQNTGTDTESYNFTCQSSGPVTCGAVNPTSATFPPSQIGSPVTVNFTAGGAPGGAIITLRAQQVPGGAIVEQDAVVNVVGFSVTVAATGGSTGPDLVANTTGHSLDFTVTNTGSDPNTFTLTCAPSGTIQCLLPPTSVPLGAGASTTVSVPFNVSGADLAAFVELQALGGGGASASARVNFAIKRFAVIVGALTTGAEHFTNTGPHTFVFNVENDGTARDTFVLDAQCAGLTCSQPGPVILEPQADQNVQISYSTGASVGDLTIALTATARNGVGPSAAAGGAVKVIAVDFFVTGPSGPPVIQPANALNLEALFTIDYSGDPRTFTLSCSPSGAVSSCGLDSNVVTIGGIEIPDPIRVTYATGATPGAGGVTLNVTFQGATQSATADVDVVRFGVEVTSTTPPPAERVVGGGPYVHDFLIRNTGSGGFAYFITCARSGNITFTPCVSPTGTVPAGGETTVRITYDVNAPDAASFLSLTATGGFGTRDSVRVTFPANSYGSLVEPFSTPQPQFVSTGPYSFTFRVINTGTTRDQFTFALACDVDCPSVPAPLFIDPGDTVNVAVGYSTTEFTGARSITLTALGEGGGGTVAQGTGIVTVIPIDFVVEIVGDSTIVVPSDSAGQRTSFRVRNEGLVARIYQLGCVPSGSVTSCELDILEITLDPDGEFEPEAEIGVTFATGAADSSASITFAATTGGATVGATLAVNVVRFGVSVAVADTVPDEQIVGPDTIVTGFAVTNTGSANDTFTFTCPRSTNVTVTRCQGLLALPPGTAPFQVVADFTAPDGTVLRDYDAGAFGRLDNGSGIDGLFPLAIAGGRVVNQSTFGSVPRRAVGDAVASDNFELSADIVAAPISGRRDGAGLIFRSDDRSGTGVNADDGDFFEVFTSRAGDDSHEVEFLQWIDGAFTTKLIVGTVTGWERGTLRTLGVTVSGAIADVWIENEGVRDTLNTLDLSTFPGGDLNDVAHQSVGVMVKDAGLVTGLDNLTFNFTPPPTPTNALVSYTVDSADSTSFVRLVASGGGNAKDSAEATFVSNSFGAFVDAPPGAPESFENTDSNLYTFDLTNTGSTFNTYTLNVFCGALSCTVPDSVQLSPGAGETVRVTYSTSATLGLQDITLTASGAGGGGTTDSGTGFVRVIAVDFSIATPDSAVTKSVGAVGLRASFLVINENPTETRTYAIACVAGGEVSSCEADISEITLEPLTIPPEIGVTYATSADIGSGTVTLTATVNGATVSRTIAVNVVRFGVVVAAADTLQAARFAGPDTVQTGFRVDNSGSIDDTYNFACLVSTNLTLVSCPASLTLSPTLRGPVAEDFTAPDGTILRDFDAGAFQQFDNGSGTEGSFPLEIAFGKVFNRSNFGAFHRRAVGDTIVQDNFELSVEITSAPVRANKEGGGLIFRSDDLSGLDVNADDGDFFEVFTSRNGTDDVHDVRIAQRIGGVQQSFILVGTVAGWGPDATRTLGVTVRGASAEVWIDDGTGRTTLNTFDLAGPLFPSGDLNDAAHRSIGLLVTDAGVFTGLDNLSLVFLPPSTTANALVAYTVNTADSTSFVGMVATGTAGAQDGAQFDFVALSPVFVTAAADTVARQQLTLGHEMTFQVENDAELRSFLFSCTATGQAACAGVTPTSAEVDSVTPLDVVVRYDALALGEGTITLTATAEEGTFGEGSGAFVLEVENFDVTVGPADSLLAAQPSRDTLQASFTIENTGTARTTYTFECVHGGQVFCLTTPAPLGVDSGATAAVTVDYETGLASDTGNVLTLVATSVNFAGATDAGSYRIPVIDVGVVVTPDQKGVGVLPGTDRMQVFTLRNLGSEFQQFDVQIACGGIVRNCPLPALRGLTAGQVDSVVVAYTVDSLGVVGDSGTIDVVATQVTDPTVTDGGNAIVVIGTALAPVVSLGDANSGTSVERSVCLTVAAGPGASIECGDLRLGHGVPPVTAQNRTRAPLLTYNSRHADATILVAANVLIPDGGVTPDSVVGIFSVGGDSVQTIWDGSGFSPGRASRVVMNVSKLDLPQGAHDYTLEIKALVDSMSLDATDQGRLPVVRRDSANSLLGLAGWWLAGVEELVLQGDTLFWIGGDGSTREYLPVAGPPTPDTWVAAPLSRPDTIKLTGTGADERYVRFLPGGLEVRFDTSGMHLETVNRLGHKTRFEYEGRLNVILLESPERPVFPGWKFHYSDNTLDSVRAAEFERINENTLREKPVLRRTTGIVRDGARVTGIVDPDGTTVGFGYDGALPNQITSRTDKRGTVTSFAYDVGQAVRQVSTDMGLGQEPIVTGFVSTATRGLVAAEDTAAAYSLLDGPRTDVADTTRFWLDRFGQPVRIADALDNETTIARDEPTYPLLATEVVSPLDFISRATYDDRGNVDTTTTISGADVAVTAFEWDGTFDFVTKITLPEEEVTEIEYDPVNGNRLSQKDGRGDSTKVTFDYYDGKNKSPLGLLRTVTSPLSGTTTVTYGNQGNLHTVTDPLGFVTTMHKDAFGRDTLVVTPIDAAHHQLQRIVYDIMGRVDSTITIGPALGALPEDRLVIANTYDLAGNLLTVTRRAVPDSNLIGAVISTFEYDPANRVVLEVQHNRLTRTVYDLAGNVVQSITGRGDTLLMRYDVLNRLSRRVVPSVSYEQTGCVEHSIVQSEWFCAGGMTFPTYPNDGVGGLVLLPDTSRFTYDAVGSVLSAVNGYSWVFRTYNPDGTLATDSSRIRTYEGTDSTTHVYGLTYDYDLNGRRTSLFHPDNLAASAAQSVQQYEYTSFGALGAVTNVLGNRYTFGYDAESRLVGLGFPGGLETRAYDAGGRLIRRRTEAAFLLRDDSLAYDSRSRLASVDRIGSPENWIQATMGYSGLGALTSVSSFDVGGRATTEEFRQDAHGNMLWKNSRLGAETADTVRFGYANGLLDRTFSVPPTIVPLTYFVDTTFTVLDGSGNVVRRTNVHQGFNGAFEPENREEWFLRNASERYYGADQRLLFQQVVRDSVQRAIDVSGPTNFGTSRAGRGAWEEYWYDALGRRVLKRTRTDSLCQTGVNAEVCFSTMERYVWDGDQLLYELRFDGGDNQSINLNRTASTTSEGRKEQFGWLAYTHGAGIDAPLDVVRHNFAGSPFAIVLHADFRGENDAGTDTTGARFGCPPTTTFDCLDLDWPAQFGFAFHDQDGVRDPPVWIGSLIQSQRDASGLLYRRNRYYDPSTGQFTQQDPIGLGGGLNLYGFANGDPVNFRDPFGRCPEELRDDEAACEQWNRERVRQALEFIEAELEQGNVYAVSVNLEVVGLNAEAISAGCTQSPTSCIQPLDALIWVNADRTPEAIAVSIMHEIQHLVDIGNAGNEIGLPGSRANERCPRWRAVGFRQALSGGSRRAATDQYTYRTTYGNRRNCGF